MQNVYPPPPKGKILLLSLALSQLLQGANITFSSTNGTSNTATQDYAKYDSPSQTLTISENTTPAIANSTLEFKNVAKGRGSDESYEWWIGLDSLTSQSEVRNFDINTPTSKLILVSLPESSGAKSISLGEGSGSLKIKAKEIQIGDGTQTYSNIFACSNGGGGGCPATMNIMSQNSSIEGNVVVNQDGALMIGNNAGSLSSFTLQGDLTIKSGGLAIAAMGGGENPVFNVNGKADINNATFQTFVNTRGNMQDLRIVSAKDGISLSGDNKMQIATSYFLQDFIDIDKEHIDYGYAKQTQTDLYVFTLKLDGNTLYATPELSEVAKQEGVVKLIRDATNKIATGFYNSSKDSFDETNRRLEQCASNPSWNQGDCSAEGKAKLQKKLQDYQASLDGLTAYLQKQVDEGYIEAPSPYTLLSSTPISESSQSSSRASTPSSSSTLSTTGFDNIDSKLSIIKDGANNSLAESIKNSNNNLLAVNFVNTMMQGYNNTPIELLNEVKSNLSMSASISSFLRNDLHTSLALASRFASFSFAPKVSQANSLQTQAFLDNDLDPKESVSFNQESVSSFSPNLSNSLWANAFGGANLLGSEVGASYGLNLGYDKNLENALVGTYLSYEYATLAPSLLTLNVHNIKLGVYSRIQEGGNEIDVELSSLLSIISQESATKALDSLSTANYLSSLTELKTTYGYALLEGDFKLKPLVGLALSFSYTPGFKEEGDILIDFSSFYNFNASIQAGLEFRANFSNKGFLYTLLSIEQDLYNSLDSLSINSQSLPITQDLKTYAQVLLGGEIAISKDWNIVLSLGAKQSIVGSKDYEDKTINETYISGSVGVGYRF